MKRICITGAGSMIGAALTEYALSQGTAVLALVRPGSAHRLLFGHSLFDVAPCDLSRLGGFASDLPCDGFAHLGWQATYGEARADAAAQAKNVEYTAQAVRLAERLGCRAFVFAGSQAEYGLCDAPLRADTPCFPITAYGKAKLAAGNLSRDLCRQAGIRHCHARILSVYGAADRPQTLVSACVDAMLRGEAPALSDCTQIWDYLYVRDAARALYAILTRGRDGAVYPVGSGEARPLRDYVLDIRDLTGCEAMPRFGARTLPPDAVRYLQADITTLTADTGFVPQTSFREGVTEIIRQRRKEE